MKKAKYIIFDNEGLEMPVVFSPLFQHDQIAKGLNFKVIAAGFCNVEDSEPKSGSLFPQWSCWGESISLQIKSRGAIDAEVLNSFLEYRT